jgi:hypothetical protein
VVRKSPAKVLKAPVIERFCLPKQFEKDLKETTIFPEEAWRKEHLNALERALSAHRAAEKADLKASKMETLETLRRVLAGGLKGKRALELLMREDSSIDDETQNLLAPLARVRSAYGVHKLAFETEVRRRISELEGSARDGGREGRVPRSIQQPAIR